MEYLLYVIISVVHAAGIMNGYTEASRHIIKWMKKKPQL